MYDRAHPGHRGVVPVRNIVASSNDPYGTLDHARRRAAQWGAGFIELGALGHINGSSGLGDWPDGLNLLAAFKAGCRIR